MEGQHCANSEPNIHTAIEQKDVDLLRRLVNAGCDVEQMDGTVTPLMKAVLKDNMEMIDILLAAGADVNSACHVDFPKHLNIMSLTNALSFAVLRFVIETDLVLTPARYQIIERLIAAGSELNLAEHLQHFCDPPLQNACRAQLWPVVVELINAGCEVNSNGPHDVTPLVTTASVAYHVGEDPFTCSSWQTALSLLVAKSHTLRVRVSGWSLFKQLIERSSAKVLCVLLKADKPAYGIEEAVDVLEYGNRDALLSIATKHGLILDHNKLSPGCMFCPLAISIAYLLQHIHRHCWYDMNELCICVRRQFSILRLLLDARVPVYQLDKNFRRFLQVVRHWLNADSSHCEPHILDYGNQVLDAIESRFGNPRKLVEICRTHVRYELNIRGLSVHHIRDCVSKIVEKYLLYGDLLEPEEYTISLLMPHTYISED